MGIIIRNTINIRECGKYILPMNNCSMQTSI